MMQWICYFLTGITESAELAIITLNKIFELEKELKNRINQNFGRKIQNALLLLNYLFKHPVVNVKDVAEICKVTPKTANSLVDC